MGCWLAGGVRLCRRIIDLDLVDLGGSFIVGFNWAWGVGLGGNQFIRSVFFCGGGRLAWLHLAFVGCERRWGLVVRIDRNVGFGGISLGGYRPDDIGEKIPMVVLVTHLVRCNLYL